MSWAIETVVHLPMLSDNGQLTIEQCALINNQNDGASTAAQALYKKALELIREHCFGPEDAKYFIRLSGHYSKENASNGANDYGLLNIGRIH